MIQAKIIADSLSLFGDRITTFELIFPRIVLAEFNTHRMISKNSASSRAIPFEKMLKMVQENPFIPIKFMVEHKGMQGTEYFNEVESMELELEWLKARDAAIVSAKALSEIGLTKQICNRILEPFMWHKVIATGTEWQNFFALRAHDAAEIHIQQLAHAMLNAYNVSTPKQLKTDEWHIPFGDNIDMYQLSKITQAYFELNPSESYNTHKIDEFMIKVATARCARVSYTVVGEESKPDNYANDIKLHDRLAESGHYSPMEHCAICMSEEEYYKHYNGKLVDSTSLPGPGIHQYGWSGNFKGFIQYRKTLTNENRTDNRVKTYYKLKSVSSEKII